jgi:Winged helix DNA-binding domain
MDSDRIVGMRMRNLRLWGPPAGSPEGVVGHLGAIQGQEFAYARWSVGQRTKGSDDAAIGELFDAGAILRTHLLRPTWHLVLPTDIRWILKVTAPRVHALNAYIYRKLGVADDDLKKSNKLLEKYLAGGSHMTRKEIGTLLERSGIDASGIRLAYFVMRAELDALICSGALRGKQHTYALIDERAPDATELTMDEALAELTRRYFTSRGPATVKDLSRWSSLTMGDCRKGIEMLDGELENEIVGDRTYWFVPAPPARRPASPRVDLIQVYDEYVMGFSESRDALTGPIPSHESRFMHAVLMDGKLIGHWKRTEEGKTTVVEVDTYEALDNTETQALEKAVERFGRFLGRAVDLR